MKNRALVGIVGCILLTFAALVRGQGTGATYALSPAVFVRDGWSLYFILQPAVSGQQVVCVAALADTDRTLAENLVGVCYYPSYDSYGTAISWTGKSWIDASHKDVIKSLSLQFPLTDPAQWEEMTGIVGLELGTPKTQLTLIDGLLEGDPFSNVMSDQGVREVLLPVLVQLGYSAADLFTEKDAGQEMGARASLLSVLSVEATAATKFIQNGSTEPFVPAYSEHPVLQQIASFDYSNGGAEQIKRTKWTLKIPAGAIAAAFDFDVFVRPALVEMTTGVIVAQSSPGIVVPVWRSIPPAATIFGLSAACAMCAATQPANQPDKKIWIPAPPGNVVGPIPTGRWYPPYTISYTPSCVLIGGKLYVLAPFYDPTTGKFGFAWSPCDRVT